ncbi:MAG TPA: TolC family protein [Fibrobacteria bacterium]|nr:TolC family protein [Fibrobacteria bacterium]
MKTLSLLLLLPPLAVAQVDVPLLTHADALRIGGAGNLDLQGTRAQQEAAEAGSAAALGGLLPSLTLTSSLSRVGPNFADDPRGGVTSGANTVSPVGVSPDMQASNTFQLSWAFLNLGAFGNWRAQADNADASKIQTRGQSIQLSASIDLAYYDVVRQQALLAAQRQEVDLSRARRDIARAHRAIGVSSALELMQAQLAVDADSAALLTQATDLDLSRRSLNTMLGRDPRTDYSVEDSIPVDDPGPFDQILSDARSHSANLALARARADALAAQANAAGAYAIAPVVSAYANYSFLDRWHDQNPPPGVDAQGSVFGLQATWNLFSSGSQTEQWRQAKALARVGEIAKADTALALERNAVQGWDAWTRSQVALDLGERDDKLADSSLSLSLTQYKVGALAGIDLRQVQETALQAKTRDIQARWNARSAEIQLQVLAGREIR